MALKDLTIKGSVLTEKQVEDIVSKYVRYDVEERQIHFLPAFTPLKTRDKVLIYLVALNGWPFLSKEPLPTEASPATIGKAINIPGGTLRRILMELKVVHLISATGRLYKVQSAALSQIMEVLRGKAGSDIVHRRVASKKSRAKHEGVPAVNENKGKRTKRNLLEVFNNIIADGFFSQPKVIGELKDRFAEKGLNVPMTTLSRMLLRATKDERLTRKQKEVGKRKIWTYEKKK